VFAGERNLCTEKISFFLKPCYSSGRKIDCSFFLKIIYNQKKNPMKRILLVITAAVTAIIMSCNPSKTSTSTNSPNYNSTDTTGNHMNNNKTDTTHHR